jgi:hypothetical protein
MPVISSALVLLGANLGVIAAAYFDDWSLPTILVSYLMQSIVIGLFQAKKMADLTVFSTAGVKMNDHPVDPTPQTRRAMVLFFLAHYGIFHAVYMAAVLSWGAPAWPAVAASSALFFGNHLFSYVANRPAPKEPPNIGTMMFMPYVRIVPMHAFIMLGAFTAGGRYGIVLFMILKTLADEAMHLLEHRTGMQAG